MALNHEFISSVKAEISKLIDLIGKENQDYKTVWNCLSEDDFLYGWYISESNWLCLHLFYDNYEREPDKKETAEIQSLILDFSKTIQEKIKNRK